MNVLFLGGTRFVGRHVAEALVAAGHTVTFFNRGMSDASLFPEQRHVRGDRAGDVSALRTIEPEIVIDTSGYTPDAVAASARAVAESVRKYVFMSSIDAYDKSGPRIDESSPTKELSGETSTSEMVPEFYGALKARCERDLAAVLGPTRVLAVRAGLMVGPYDATDRFTYWPVRVASGGEVLAPVGRAMPVQIVDARDVARWIVGALERDLTGPYNLVGTPGSIAFGDVLDACAAVARSSARFTWVTSDFLEANAVAPWVELPLWIPDVPELLGSRNVANDRARATGFETRPLAETVADVLEEFRVRPPDRTLRAGLTPDREARLLQRWHAREDSTRR